MFQIWPLTLTLTLTLKVLKKGRMWLNTLLHTLSRACGVEDLIGSVDDLDGASTEALLNHLPRPNPNPNPNWRSS